MNSPSDAGALSDLLHTLSPTHWPAPWQARDAMPLAARALEMVATLLDGRDARYVEQVVDGDGEAPAFEILALADDRVVRVAGIIADQWPSGTVVPRRELRSIELRRVPYAPYGSSGTRDADSAEVRLDYGTLQITLPLKPSTLHARRVAQLLPSLVADRMASEQISPDSTRAGDAAVASSC